jgi:hypothetical protein
VVVHYRMADPGETVSGGTTSFVSDACWCACSICMSGSCCRFPRQPYIPVPQPYIAPPPYIPTTTGTGTDTTPAPLFCLPTEHDFMQLDGALRVFCRHCGTSKDV